MPFGIGITELLVFSAFLLLIFGPKRLPEMGRSIGRSMRELREGLTNSEDEPEAAPTEHQAQR
jgi:sec-independent protein translocase protein TatA